MRVVDLFAGCGGFSLGFANSGHDIVGAFEKWGRAVDCYRANFSHPVTEMDLSDVDSAVAAIAPLSPDMIIGGPPCQDFSHAGRRTEGRRAALTVAFAQIVTKVRPLWFVMENVSRVARTDTYAKARILFSAAGYGLTERVLDASLCGVPQRRKRFFCIGLLGAQDGFLDKELDMRLSAKPMTVREYLGDELGLNHYYRHPRNYNRRGVFSVDEPYPTARGVNRPVPKGYKGHPGDSAPVSPELRALTTHERALIQTFPRDYVWLGSKTDLEQMIGNAVPVKLAEFVGSVIGSYESGRSRADVLAVEACGGHSQLLH